MTAKESIQRLLEGNSRFVSGKPVHPHQDPRRRQDVAKGQEPFAVILTCSDSRIPPEIVFDCGLGDLFVIRHAGNVVNNAALATLEFAAVSLSVPLILVMGHQRCAAAQAALSGETTGRMARTIESFKAAIAMARQQPGDMLDNTARAHVRLACNSISRASPILQEKILTDQVTIIGAYYWLNKGTVELL